MKAAMYDVTVYFCFASELTNHRLFVASVSATSKRSAATRVINEMRRRSKHIVVHPGDANAQRAKSQVIVQRSGGL